MFTNIKETLSSNNNKHTLIANESSQDLINNNNKMKQSSYIISSISPFNKFKSHLKLMLWKNYLIFTRNYISTLCILLTPILVCLILSFVQFICDNYSYSFINKNPSIRTLSPLSKCTFPSDCITITYSIITTNTSIITAPQYINSIMNDVAYMNNLSFNKDIQLVSIGSYDQYVKYIDLNQNKTKYGILFCLDYYESEMISFPCKFEIQNDKEMFLYTIMYNATNSPNAFMLMPNVPSPTDSQLTKLKESIDNAYINYFRNTSVEYMNYKYESINISLQEYPSVENRLYQNEDVESEAGTFYFFFPPMFCFMFFLLEIVREKDLNLRKSLIIIGLNDCSFWLSWILSGVIFSFIITFIFIITAIICKYQVFCNTPIVITFSLFFIFSISMVFFAIFLSTLIKSLKMAYTISYAVFLIGLVMEIILMEYVVIYSLYTVNLPWWVDIAVFVFQLYPPFNFSKAFDDIATKAAPHFEYNELRFVDGDKYTWKDLFKEIKGKTVLNNEYIVPPTYQSFIWLIINSCVFIILTWYFDNVNASNKGRNMPWYFPFTKEYWNGKATYKKQKQTEETYINESNDSDIGMQTVSKEYIKVQKNKNTNKGLNIMGISKIFYLNSIIPCIKSKTLHALKPIYLHIPYGELFTLLGHNGAGKSTLINILTGYLSSTSGESEIAGCNLISGLQRVIGLCPQHDILWEELSAVEHIQLYCTIRNFHPSSIPSFINEKLSIVNLTSVANDPIKTYSGGMKRRLSILLSTIGNQKVVFLDEPTTGLDPVNRRFIWKMIQELKNDLAIVLTTHSMEEADYLSDRIAIIKNGELQCIGSPLELKKMYGGGYLLTFICENDYQNEVKEKLMNIMPSCKIVSANSGNILINVPFDKLNEMKYLTYIMNDKYESYPELMGLKGMIKECGMSYTTIEEVFLKITGEDELNEK